MIYLQLFVILISVYFRSGMGQPNDKFLTSILKVYEPMKVDNDSLRFIFDEDSLNFYLEKDISSVDDYFRYLYKDFDNQMLLDSISSSFSKYNSKYSDSIGCKLLIIGLERMIPSAYSMFGQILSLDPGCICSCNRYKGFLYLYKSTQLNSLEGFESLATFYVYNEMYLDAEQKLIEASELGNPISSYGLYELYFFGSFHYGELLEPLTEFIDKEKGLNYLNKAVDLEYPYAMFEKGNRLLESNRDLAFKLYIKTYNSIKNELDYGALYGAVVSTLEEEFKRDWRKYIRKNNIKK